MSYEVRRSETRGRLSLNWLEARFSFSFGDYVDAGRMNFSALRALNEDWIQPKTGFGMHPHQDLEILLIPITGAVAHADSLGNEAVLTPADVLMMRAGYGIRHSQMNALSDEVDHHLQLWLLPRRRGHQPGIQLRRFDPRLQFGDWQLIASPDGADQSLVVDQDARLFRSKPRHDASLSYEPTAKRCVYLHVIRGSVLFEAPDTQATELLQTGDAVAWRHAQPFKVSSLEDLGQELLLLDLPPDEH